MTFKDFHSSAHDKYSPEMWSGDDFIILAHDVIFKLLSGFNTFTTTSFFRQVRVKGNDNEIVAIPGLQCNNSI